MCLDRKWFIACYCFCAMMKSSAKPLLMSLKSPVSKMGVSRNTAFFISYISDRLSHRWRSRTSKLPMTCAAFSPDLFKELKVRAMFIHEFEDFGQKHLKDCHCMLRRPRLASCNVSFPARFDLK